MKNFKELFGDLGFIFKLVEAILCLMGTILMAGYGAVYYARSEELIIIAVDGYLLICCAFLVVYMFDESNYLMEVMLMFVGGVLNLVAGVLCLVNASDDKFRHTNSVVLSITTIACGVIMIVDFVILMRK